MEGTVPSTYRQWLEALNALRENRASDDFIGKLKNGSCSGISRMLPQFLERVQETAGSMLRAAAKRYTARINEMLSTGDFSNAGAQLSRSIKEMERCRFFRNIRFLPEDFVKSLDEKTVSEITRFFALVKNELERSADETGSADLYDILYDFNRIIKKDRRNG